MAITATDIKKYLSGGGANTDPAASIGGAISSTEVVGSTILSTVTGAQSTAGRTRYRAIYIKNTHGSLTYQSAKVWIGTDTPSADTDADVALSAQGLNATVTAIADEVTAPASVTFTNGATSEGTGLSMGDIPAGQSYGLWIKNVINASAAAVADSFTINYTGDTAP